MRFRLYFVTLTLFLARCAYAQSGDIVRSDGIVSPLHQRNIGKITFLSKMIPLDQYSEQDFLHSFALTDSSDLSIRCFLANSLTNYLHQLAPSLSVDELNKKGNYQFSFYLDNQKLYTENVHPGAGSSANKQAKTVFRIPLASTSEEDSWGRFMWSRFMMQVGEDALTEGKHQLKLEIRPYIKMPELKTGEMIANGEIELIIRKPVFRQEQISIQPIKPASGWVVGTADFDTIALRQINQKIIQRDFKDITSIVVIRSGRLVLEEYFNGASRETLHDTRSVGKTFTSALIGMAIKDGYLASENEHLGNFYKLRQYNSYTPEKEQIALKDLLTMSSPFDGSDDNSDSPGNEEKMYPTKNWVRFALDLPIDTSKLKQKRWDYFTAGVVLLGDILHQKVPGGLETYAAEKLFVPLGIKKYKWQYTPQGVVNTAGGLQLRSLDLARFGQLYLDKGRYNDKQLLTSDWVQKSLAKQVSIPDNENDFYGYLFWNTSFPVNNNAYETFYLSGNGGNKVFIFRELSLVVVITSTAYNKPYGHRQSNKILQQFLLPAFTKVKSLNK